VKQIVGSGGRLPFRLSGNGFEDFFKSKMAHEDHIMKIT
jgi:hypothetical protein